MRRRPQGSNPSHAAHRPPPDAPPPARTRRDLGPQVETAKLALQELSHAFGWSRILVYENDSEDDTLASLQSWAAGRANVTVLSETNVLVNVSRREGGSAKAARIAHCRNRLLAEAQATGAAYVVVADLDLTAGATAASLASCLEMAAPWAMCGANQPGLYYDLWALRSLDAWMPGDCWECARECGSADCADRRYLHLPPDSSPVEVLSCFGGVGVYKAAFLDGCRYEESVDSCEHVGLHACMRRRNGARLWIAPKMLAGYSTTVAPSLARANASWYGAVGFVSSVT